MTSMSFFDRNDEINMTDEKAECSSATLCGVKISPAQFVFINRSFSTVQKKKLTLQNLSCKCVNLILHQPDNQWLRLVNSKQVERWVLFPGMVLSKYLAYDTQRSEMSSSLKLSLDDQSFLLPVDTRSCRAVLNVQPDILDFGILNIGGKFADRSLSLFNSGTASTKFSVVVGTNPMQVEPKYGVLEPQQRTEIRIRAAGVKQGHHTSNIWVDCSSSVSKMIQVNITSIVPGLRIHHPVKKGNVAVLNLGTVYYGTCSYESFIVRNYSAEQTIFILTVEQDKQRQVYMDVEDEKLKNWLQVWPYHGTMEPFESMVFSLCLKPSKTMLKTGWRHKNSAGSEDALWANLKVEQVSQKPNVKNGQAVGTSKKRGSLKIHSLARPDYEESSVCIHGQAEEADIIMEPASVTMCAAVSRQDKSVIRLYNPSSRLPVHFEFIKTPYVTVTPCSGLLQPSKDVQVLLTFRAKSLGSLNSKLSLNIKSYCNMTDKEEMVTLKKKAISLLLQTESVTRLPKPHFNLGITPTVGTDVGAHTDNVRFDCDLKLIPRCAIVSLDPSLTNRPWFHVESNTIAFPNDMALKLYEKPFDDTKRSIFRGTPRYLPPPDENEAMTDIEWTLINERRKAARELIRSFAESHLGEDRHCLTSKSLSMERLGKLVPVSKPSLPQIKPMVSATAYSRPVEIVASLTPVQLFNISISPANFNFGLIPVGEECTMNLKFDNENLFPINLMFIVDEKLDFTKKLYLGPRSSATQVLTIKLNFTGKYISYFTYVVSDIHKFYKTVRAEAVQPFLKFYPSVIELALPKYRDIFQPCYTPITLKNPFSSPTNFSWQSQQKYIVDIVPESGVIRENETLTCLLYVHKFFKTRKKFMMKLWAGDTAVNSLTCYIPAFTDYRITPISPVLNMRTIGAGVKVTKPFYLFNYGCYKTSYMVRGSFPVEGIEVHPRCGIIAPKSLETLELSVRLDCLMIINFDIVIDIEGISTKKIQVLGNISFPTVEFEPNMLNFITTKCYSFSTQPVKIVNRTGEEVNLTFSLKELVQFKITRTSSHYDPEVPEEGISVKGNSCEVIFVHFKPEHIAAYDFYLPVKINGFLGPPDTSKDSNRSSDFMSVPVDMPPCNKRSLKPNALSSQFNVTLKPPEFFDAVWVTCVVRPPDIVVSNLEVSLECCLPEQSVLKKIYISNPKDEPVTVHIGKANYPFRLKTMFDDDPSPFVIAGKGRLDLTVVFKPFKTGSWSVPVPLSIVKGSSTTHYNDLLLTGICHPSSLYCPTTELYLIPVPLGTRIDKKIVITAAHQREDTDLKIMTFCKVNVDRKIGVEFPDSPHIPRNTKGVPVTITISFLSSDVISVEIKLIFRDGMEGELEITLFATATDSLIPNHWFYFNSHLAEEEAEEVKSKTGLIRSGSVSSRESAMMKRYFTAAIGWRDSEITEVYNLVHKPRHSSASMLHLPCNVKELSTHNFADDEQMYYWIKIHGYVSRWLLYSVFSGSYQPQLEDITWSKSFIDQSQLKPPAATTKSFIDLIVALFGSDILAKTSLTSEMPGVDDFARINFSLRAYSKMLSHLDVYGVGLSHISPLYLLNYQDYLLLYQWRRDRVQGAPLIELPSMIKTKKDFEAFSRRMWLEFYLQLFKSHTLDMCVGLAVVDDWPKQRHGTLQSFMTLSEYHSSGAGLSNRMAFDRMSPISKIITGDMLDQVSQQRSHSEAVLLAWISRTYNKVRDEDTLELPPLQDNKIMDLSTSLRNGVVLAGVTVYYCPFLAPFFASINREPISIEEICHNANHLILAWDEVKMGMMVKSEDMLECNPIFMMMLVANLYLSLPTFLPAYVLRAAVPLADAGTTVLSVNNQSNFELRYYAKLYQDAQEPFSILGAKPYYVVKPRGTTNITIHFVSNRIGKVSGLLVLCGANGPQIHGVNISVKLEGEPTLIKISNKITVRLPMYQQVFFHQKIFSPYDKLADYTMAVSISKPSIDHKYLVEWNSRNKCRIPLMIVTGCKSMSVPPYPSYGVVQLACCIYVTSRVVRWITFNSLTAGDFVCKVILEPTEEKNPNSFRIEYPIYSGSCSAEKTFIPVELRIPCANLAMVKTTLEMLSLVVRYDELYFYRKYWGRYIGLKLLEQEILTLCPNLAGVFKRFFQATVTFDIACDSSFVHLPKQITIPDVHSEDFIILHMRLSTKATEPFSALLKLTWAECHEQRLYLLHFRPSATPTQASSNQPD